ncbi:tetratricopeptide repeat protein [Streptomyces sp. NPDC013953]|uniref:tetratricopeptide repeat protein n=1 Tax=Streptomyces sp. NPDC013953 TaxID=3364868 RepID=UPI0036F8AFE7
MLGERKERLFRAYHRSGRNPEALALCTEIIGDREEFNGPDDLSVCIWTDNFAHLLHDAGDFAGVIARYERAIHGLTEISGARHPDLAFRRHNLAIPHLEDGHPQRALPHLEHALAIREGASGPHHADTLDELLTLISAYAQAGRLDKAMACAQRLVTSVERVAPQHPRLPELQAYRERLARALGETGSAAPGRDGRRTP